MDKDEDIAVSVIDAPDYFAQSHCTFVTDGEVALQGAVAEDGTQQLLVGPPQPIRAVSCEGVCLPTYGMLLTFLCPLPPMPASAPRTLRVTSNANTDQGEANCYENGQPVGVCCAGFCAANKCRPWVNPTA